MFESYRKERAAAAAVVAVGLPSLSCLNPPVTAKLSVGIGYPVVVIWKRHHDYYYLLELRNDKTTYDKSFKIEVIQSQHV